jgi:hypothetical protein
MYWMLSRGLNDVPLRDLRVIDVVQIFTRAEPTRLSTSTHPRHVVEHAVDRT